VEEKSEIKQPRIELGFHISRVNPVVSQQQTCVLSLQPWLVFLPAWLCADLNPGLAHLSYWLDCFSLSCWNRSIHDKWKL